MDPFRSILAFILWSQDMQKVLVSVLFSNWCSSLHGGDAPILFSGGKRECAAPGGREKRFVSKSRLWRVWTSTWGPNKRLSAVEASSSVGRGHSLAEIYKCVARDELLPCVGLENRFGLLLFPLPLPLIPGSAKRSEERGKRSRGHTSATPESLSHAPKCREAPSLFPKGTAHPVGDSQLMGHRLAQPSYSSKPARTDRFWTQKRLFF